MTFVCLIISHPFLGLPLFLSFFFQLPTSRFSCLRSLCIFLHMAIPSRLLFAAFFCHFSFANNFLISAFLILLTPFIKIIIRISVTYIFSKNFISGISFEPNKIAVGPQSYTISFSVVIRPSHFKKFLTISFNSTNQIYSFDQFSHQHFSVHG